LKKVLSRDLFVYTIHSGHNLPDAMPENSRKAPSFFQGGGWGWCCFLDAA